MNPSEVNSILVVQDGAEATRHAYADNESFLRQVISNNYLMERNLQLRVVVDEDCAFELAGITPDKYVCVIFSSNALIRQDGPIVRSVKKNAEDLAEYVRHGGGILVLHQSFADEELQVNLFPMVGPYWLVDRGNDNIQDSVAWTAESDTLARFPNMIGAAELSESGRDGHWVASFPLYYSWMVIDAESSLVPLIVSRTNSKRVLAAGAKAGGTVLITTIAVDWAESRVLTENFLSYVIDGLPRLVVVAERSEVPAEVALSLTKLNQQTSVLDLTQNETLDKRRVQDPNFLAQVAETVLVVSSAELESSAESYLPLLRPGGRMIVWTPSINSQFDRLVVTAGSSTPLILRKALQHDLVSLGISEWAETALVHDIRDVLLAAVSLGQPGQDLVDAASEGILARCHSWFRFNRAELDPGTALTAALVMALCGEEPPGEVLSVANDDSLKLMAAISLGSKKREEIATLWGDMSQSAAQSGLTAGAAVRHLDLARSINAKGMIDVLPRIEASFAHSLAGAFPAREWSSTFGWASIDRTASLVSGLVALSSKGLTTDLVSILARAAAPLSQWLTLEENAQVDHVLSRIRVHEALLRLELSYPSRGSDVVEDLVVESHGSRLVAERTSQVTHLLDELSESRSALKDARGLLAEAKRREEESGVMSVEELRISGLALFSMWVVAVLGLVAAFLFLGFKSISIAVNGSGGDLPTNLGSLAATVPVLGILLALGRHLRFTRRRTSAEDPKGRRGDSY
jgi:hypothetical protein